MSQVSKRALVRQMAGSMWPRREADGNASVMAARLRKLEESQSTGMLPMSGRGQGTIFFRGGQVVYAESNRTPTGDQEPVAGPSLARIASLLVLTERTVDAATELLSGESRCAKFRQSDALPPVQLRPMPVDALLAEVDRRRRVLSQLAAVITADTRVVRNESSDWPRIQVSPPQWALVVRAGDGTTPRALAMELGRSVFATTIEAYRLLALGLLAVPGHPFEPDGRPSSVMSFMRAASADGQ